MEGQPPRISVVIPVRDEQDSLDPLVDSLRGVLVSPYELIFVDDGSTDQTRKRLKTLHEPGRVRVLCLKKPSGKTAALAAGLAASRGGIVFTMDGDLQDDPAEIPRFVEQLDAGYDLVCGWKKKRRDPIAKIVASRIFNFATRRLTGLALHDVNCGFKAFRGDVARSLQLHGEMHRFIPVLVAEAGHRVGEIEVTHHPRRHGRSKYGFARLLKGFLDLVTVVLVTRFRERPAHGFGLAALGSWSWPPRCWVFTCFSTRRPVGSVGHDITAGRHHFDRLGMGRRDHRGAAAGLGQAPPLLRRGAA